VQNPDSNKVQALHVIFYTCTASKAAPAACPCPSNESRCTTSSSPWRANHAEQGVSSPYKNPRRACSCFASAPPALDHHVAPAVAPSPLAARPRAAPLLSRRQGSLLAHPRRPCRPALPIFSRPLHASPRVCTLPSARPGLPCAAHPALCAPFFLWGGTEPLTLLSDEISAVMVSLRLG